MNLQEKIQRHRKQKKWSQSELAKVLGISRDAVSKYERGDMTPSVEVVRRLAEVFEVSLDYLLGEQEGAVLDKKALSRLEAIAQLADQEREALYAVIDAYLRDSHARKAYALP